MTSDVERLLKEHGSAPEHGPGFERRLWAQIDAEGGRRDAARGGRAVPAHPRRLPWRRAVLAAAVVAAVLAVAVVSGRHAVNDLRQPQVASAAEVVANVKTAMQTVTSISASVVEGSAEITGPKAVEWQKGWTSADWFARAKVGAFEEGPAQMRLLATADGRRRVEFVTADARPLTIATYDATAGIWSVYSPGMQQDDAHKIALVMNDFPLGPPDRDDVNMLWFERNVMSSAMAGGTVSPTTYDGRPALLVSAAVTPGPAWPQRSDGQSYFENGVDRIEVTVDQAAWFPVRVRELLHGDVIRDIRLTDVRFNLPVRDEQVAPSFPQGWKVRTIAENPRFRRLSFAAAAHAFADGALAPGALPEGFRPVAAAVAERARFWTLDSSDKAWDWPWGRDVTALGYRAGFLTFTVTSRLQDKPHDPRLDDPFARYPEWVATPAERETVTLSGGALAGVTAQLATPLRRAPHLWAFKDGRLFTVAGDLTREQLLSVANSLEPLK